MPVISSELVQIRSTGGSPDDQAPMLSNHALRRALVKEMLRVRFAGYASEAEAEAEVAPVPVAAG
jgi:hypothetical protein